MTSGRFGGGGGHVPLLPTPGSGPEKDRVEDEKGEITLIQILISIRYS